MSYWKDSTIANTSVLRQIALEAYRAPKIDDSGFALLRRANVGLCIESEEH